MLDRAVEKRVRAEAQRRGIDPEEAVTEATRLADAGDEASEPEKDAKPDGPSRPTFERLLIGVLPFITVRELRTNWLGLTESVPDDGMMCGDFQSKHGVVAASDPAGVPE